jgi:rfaE bifunctional protein nucleotidyltransferase chain/domain
MNNTDKDLKIYTFDSIQGELKKFRKSGKTIALCHGVFDLLHPGHLTHFEEASKIADILVVSLTSDRYVNKGPGRPLFDEKMRAQSLNVIELIDFIVISDQPTAIEVLNSIKPDYYVKGPDYLDAKNDVTGMISREKEIVESFGGKILFTKGFTSSSSTIINEHYSKLDSVVQDWIKSFKSTHGLKAIVECIDSISKLKTLVIGETIIDRYTYCSPLAKSSKDPLLAFQIKKSETFPGGVLAIANNCASWASKVRVNTFVSSRDQLFNSISSNINLGIDLDIIEVIDRPTILKHRYVDEASNVRVFEYYDFNEASLPLSKIEIQKNGIENLQIFFSVNAQSNAGNRGYNTISKFSRANLITFNGGELQLELRDRNPNYFKIVPEIMKNKNSTHAIVTLGGDGLIVFNSKGEFEKVPAFAQKLVDKVGAGDAVFAISSLLAKVDAPLKVIGFLANLVASHEVSQLGHQKSLSIPDLIKHSKAMLG